MLLRPAVLLEGLGPQGDGAYQAVEFGVGQVLSGMRTSCLLWATAARTSGCGWESLVDYSSRWTTCILVSSHQLCKVGLHASQEHDGHTGPPLTSTLF
jgi:hypothetical protein